MNCEQKTTESSSVIKNIEDLLDVEKEIHRLIERKKRTDLHIIGLEARIYSIETDYIRDAAPLGSILTPAGMDAYLGAGTGLPIGSSTSGTSNVGNNPANRKLVVQPPTEADRIFSNTSSSYQRALAAYSRLVREKKAPTLGIGSNSNDGVTKNENTDQVKQKSVTSSRPSRSRSRDSRSRKRALDSD